MNNDLISRSALLRIINTMTFDRRFSLVKHLIEATPTIDAKPVQHGRWENGYRYKNCSLCGWEHPEEDHQGFSVADIYCPNCGAKMDATT